MAQWLDAKVTHRTDWNDHLFSLAFSCKGFPEYKAGQFTKIGLAIEDGKVLSRPYSLVSTPQQSDLEIIAVPVEDGALSPQLHKLNVGDNLKVMSPATGFLVLDEVPQSESLWLLATGTGVGPFLSMMQTPQPWQTYKKVVLVYAARFIQDLAYMPLINAIKQQQGDAFQFIPVVSREEGQGFLKGRIPDLIKDKRIETQAQIKIDAETSQVMLCGNPDMISQTVALLESMGLTKHLRRSPGQISMERYW